MKMKCNKAGDGWRVTGGEKATCFSNFRHPSPVTRHALAFSLLEVMFAVVVFCTATFAILALVSQSLDNVRRLQRPPVDAGQVAAWYAVTNKLYEGTESGNLGDMLGDPYRGYSWTADIGREINPTNNLFHVDIVIVRNDNRSVVSAMRVLYYKPDSPQTFMGGGLIR